jgi:hypothetical protein
MIYNRKSNWKDAMWYQMAYESPFKSQKQLHFHLFGDAIKNVQVYFSSSFLSKLTLVTSLNHMCNCKPFCNPLGDYKSFLVDAKENNRIYSCKNGWFGHKSQTLGLEWIGFLVMTTTMLNDKLWSSKVLVTSWFYFVDRGGFQGHVRDHKLIKFIRKLVYWNGVILNENNMISLVPNCI